MKDYIYFGNNFAENSNVWFPNQRERERESRNSGSKSVHHRDQKVHLKSKKIFGLYIHSGKLTEQLLKSHVH